MASGADWRLIVISKQTHVGNLPGGHEVYRIDRIAALTLSSSESPEFDLDVSTTAYVTLHGKTDTNAFPLNGLEKRL